MPGMFNSAALTPLSAPTVGQLPPPSTGQMLGQAAEAYPDMLQKAAEKKLQMDSQKLSLKKQQSEMDQQESSQAMAKLGFFYRLMMGDQTGSKSKDPQMIAAVTQAGKTAGVGPLTITDPVTGAQVVDVAGLKHLVDSKLLSQLDDTTQTQIGQALPANRPGMYAQHGVDPATVPPETMSMAPNLPPKDRTAVRHDVMNLFKEYTTGQGTIGSLTAQLNSMLPDMQAAGMSIDDVKNYLSSDEYKDQLGPAVQAKVANLEAIGISKEAQAKYYTQKTIDEPKDLASKIATRAGRLVIQQEQADTSRQRMDTARLQQEDQARKTQGYLDQVKANVASIGKKADMAGLTIAYRAAAKNLDVLKDKRDALAREASAYIMASNGRKEPPQDIQDALKQIDQQISDGEAQLQNVIPAANAASNNKFSSMIGKPATVTGTIVGKDGKTYVPSGNFDANGKPTYKLQASDSGN